jgi:iron complex outermembrane recepter protein
VGLFLFKDIDRQPTVTDLLAAGLVNRLNPIVRTESIAAFGQATIALGSRLSGIVGLRYTNDDKTMDNSGGSTTRGTTLSSFQYRDSAAAAAWTPKFGFNLQLREEAVAYASATRGFKSGGFNASAASAGRSFAPEWAWTSEVGVKASVLNKRVTLNGAAYFTDYTDLQVQTHVRPGVIDITNAATASIRGIEVESQVQPAPGWSAGGHVAWLDARYDRYTAVGPDGSPIDAAGRRLSNAPEWSGRAWLEYARPFRHVGVFSLFLDVVSQSTVFFTPLNDRIQQQRSHSLVSANITIRPRPHWSVGVYARNVTDTDYITGTIGSLLPAIAGRPGEPRQVGVQLTLAMTTDRPRAWTEEQNVRH